MITTGRDEAKPAKIDDQVPDPAASAVDTTQGGTPGRAEGAPWRGRRKVADPKSKIVPIRFSAEQYAVLVEKANRAGLSVGTAARAILLGSAGPRAVKRPPVEKAQLARLLGLIGRLGGNVNQIAHALNEGRDPPARAELSSMRADIAAMRAEVMIALGRGPREEPLPEVEA